MPAYTPPPQVLISPVTSFYKGKAIRQQFAAGEADLALKKKDLEQADTKFDLSKRRVKLEQRRIEQADKQIKMREDAYAQARKEYEDEVGEKQAKRTAFDIYRSTEEINGVFQSGGKTPDAEAASLELAREKFSQIAESMPEGERKAKLMEMLEGGITADEYRSILDISASNSEWYGFGGKDEEVGYAAKDTYIGEDGKEYHMLIDDAGGITKTKIPAKTEAGKPINYDPPNNAELESAEALISDDDVLDDLPRDQKKVAKMMLASDIRNLQEDLGKSYGEAAAMAIAGLKAKVDLEPDFFTGTDSKLDIASSGLAENEYQGPDGHVYVEAEDGSFKRKD